MVNRSKGESHVVDNHRNPVRSVAAWLFRGEYQPAFSENRQLDSYPARHCSHSRCFEFAGNRELIAPPNCAQPNGAARLAAPLHTKQESIFPMKKCNQVMTKEPVCCLPDDSVSKAAQLMQRDNIGSIPVIDNDKTQKLVGIVTDRDLVLKVIAKGLDAKTTKVEAVMTRQLVTCLVEDELQKALDAMAEHQLRRIPIVDTNHKILGIIAQADVATRVNQPEKTAEMVKEISQPKAR
jgi:CBS domain-containing protein